MPYAADNTETAKQTFRNVKTIKFEAIQADIQFVQSPDNSVAVFALQPDFAKLQLNIDKNILYIRPVDNALQGHKLTVFLPGTTSVDLEALGKSRIFFPEMQAPLKLTLLDDVEVTVAAVQGLILKQTNQTKVKINQLSGDVVCDLEGDAVLQVLGGEVLTSSITLSDSANLNMAAVIGKLKLETRGKSKSRLRQITDSFVWNSAGMEEVLVENLYGNADLTANYDSKILVTNARLNLLLAATSSTAKIKIQGKVMDVNLSAKGASEITIDRVAGKVLGKTQRNISKIRILYP